LFIDPNSEQIKTAAETGAGFVELHTGRYSEAFGKKDESNAFSELKQASNLANNLGLIVNAGHGLNYQNVKKILTIPNLYELNIGHTIISRAVFAGLERAVKDMKDILNKVNFV